MKNILAISAVLVVPAVCIFACADSPPGDTPGPASQDAATETSPGALDAEPDVEAGDRNPPPLPVTCGVNPCVKSLVAGTNFICALLDDATVRCWGSNVSGQLGANGDAGIGAPAPVSSLVGATQVAAGGNTACARINDGGISCWGENTLGQLGRALDGGAVVDTTSSSSPEPVSNLASALSVAVGPTAVCALQTDHAVRCWGDGSRGVVGADLVQAALAPTTTALALPPDALAVGLYAGIARNGDGVLVSWGKAYTLENGSTLGRSVSVDPAAPGPLTELGAVSHIASSATRACAIKDGVIQCWGQTDALPAAVRFPSHVLATSVAVGESSGCATLTDGTAWCWGANGKGELGDGTDDNRFAPVQVAGLSGFAVQVAVMTHAACALLATGAVMCWGWDGYGNLGDGASDTAPHLVPKPVVF